MSTCAECRFWHAPESGDAHGVCGRITDPSANNPYTREELDKADAERAEASAFVEGPEGANLCTKPTFGCSLFKAAIP